jgi:hypothetical protein
VLEGGGTARILLENSAGSGNMLGARFTQIGALLEMLGRDPRLGLCLDTAHAFASGYDLRTDTVVGLAPLRLAFACSRPAPERDPVVTSQGLLRRIDGRGDLYRVV